MAVIHYREVSYFLYYPRRRDTTHPLPATTTSLSNDNTAILLTQPPQSLRPPKAPPSNPPLHHIPPNRRPGLLLLLPRRLHPPRKPLPALRRHLHRTLEQIPHRLLTLHSRTSPTTTHRSPPSIPQHHRKPGSRSPNVTAMVTDDGVATLNRQRLPLLQFPRHINDLPFPH